MMTKPAANIRMETLETIKVFKVFTLINKDLTDVPES